MLMDIITELKNSIEALNSRLNYKKKPVDLRQGSRTHPIIGAKDK